MLRRLLLLLLAVLAATHGGESRPAAISVVLDDNYPPYCFRDGDGGIHGILVDQWRLFASRNGVKVELDAMDWGDALARMRAGRADVIDTIFKTPPRTGWLDFTAPYARLEVVAFFDREIQGISDAASLRGFPVGVKAGDAAIDLLRSRGVETLVPFASYEAIVLAAKERRISVFVIDRPPAIHFLAKHGLLQRFNSSAPLDTGEFHRAVRRGDTAMLALVSDGFARLSAQELAAIERRWLGSATPDDGLLLMVGIVAGTLALILVILFALNRALRRTVDRRTAELQQSIIQLHKQTAFVRTLINTIPDLVWLKDRQGVYLACNPTFERFFGAKEEDILGRTDHDFVAREVADSLREHDGRAMAAGSPTVNEEWVTFAADGRRVLLETINTPMRSADGTLIGVLGIGRDISRRKLAEDGLRESEARFRAMFDGASDGILIADSVDRRFRFANPAICRILGWSEAELLQLGVDDIHPGKDLERMHQAFGRQLQGEMKLLSDAPILTRDGSLRWCDINSQPIRIAGLTCLMGIFRDVTQQRQVAEQMRQGEKLRAVGQLAAGVAHDFNNMLAGILGAAELVERKLPADSPLRRYMGMITLSADRAGELTGKLLAFSRRGGGDPAPVDLHRLLLDTIALLQNTIDRRITLTQDLRAASAWIRGDASLLQNALLNLGINAAQAMPAGGTLAFSTTTLATAPASAGMAEGPCLAIEVRDSGHGIPAEHLPRIFEPFFTTKPIGQGAGLGLAVVFGTVQQHRGAIEVQSTVGVGTTFRLLLPLGSAGPAPAPAPAIQTGGGSNLILVVDDEAVLRDTLTAGLEELGHRVLTAADGSQAVELFAAHHEAIDLVILDMIMPSMNGRDCFAAMRLIDPGVRAILVSGYTPDEDLAVMQTEGLRGLLRKPFRSAELAEVLGQALG